MEQFLLTKKDYYTWAVFGLFLVFLGWLGFLLTLAGYFYMGAIIPLFIAGIIGTIYFYRPAFRDISKEFIGVISVSLLVVIIFSFFVTPSIFSGRDQGSISEAAIRLSQNHKLTFSDSASESFFKIYGPGKALNFPGFYYTSEGKLTTQFPLPYISWLAMFYSVWGITGLIIANAALFFFFLVSFYMLLRLFTSIRCTIAALILTVTSFTFIWFFKLTLSENLALALLWFSILQLLLFIKNTNNLYYFAWLAAAGLLFFSRIEGIFFLIASLAVIYFSLRNKTDFWKKNKKLTILLPLVIFLAIFILNLTANIYFYKEIAKALISSGTKLDIISSQGYFLFYLSLLWNYGIAGFLLLGIAGIIYFIKKKRFEILVPFFVVLPSYIYLIDPKISSDHPWMLRRLVFSILPSLILYAVFLISERKEKKYHLAIFYSAVIILFLINMPSFLKYAAFSENQGLIEQTQTISQNFQPNDLVLVDRLSSGDGWTMISGPMSFLNGKKAAYFFNPYDLARIDLKKFERIYLITPEENIGLYQNIPLLKNALQYVKDYAITTTKLDINPERNDSTFPARKLVTVKGKIFEVNKEKL